MTRSKRGSLLLLFCLQCNVVIAFSFATHFTSFLTNSVEGKKQHAKLSFTYLNLKADESAMLEQKSSSSTLAKQEEKISSSALKLLDDGLKYNTTAAAELLEQIQQLRASPMSQGDKLEEFLNDILTKIDEAKTPFWTKLRPLTRFSKRARRASLRRVLDLSTPMSADDDDDDDQDSNKKMTDSQDNETAKKRRRRQAFLILLRALATPTEKNIDSQEKEDNRRRRVNIVALEKSAIRDAKAAVLKGNDMESRMPSGLETPDYTVLMKNAKKGYEIRKYEPFSICSVQMNKPRQNPSETDAKVSNPQLKGASAFGALAGYLFGKNQESTSMKMTTPVLSQGEGEEKTMAFVLPSDYWNEGGLVNAPKPLEGSGVQLQLLEGEERAVIMFGGFASKKETESRKTYLLKSLEKDPEWMPLAEEKVTLAQYNDPFTPPWKRRNEVSVKVVPRK